MDVVNLAEKFARFSGHWSPKIAGERSACVASANQ